MSINTMKRLMIICLLGLGLLALAGMHPAPVAAAPDSAPATGPLLQQSCTLPATVTTATELADCITAANANGAGLDTITLGADITLSTALPQITSEITLEGAGYNVDGASTYRIFQVTNTGNLAVNQITIQNGSATDGGGIYNAGTLTVTNSTFSNNNANAGGGIYSNGTVTVTNSTISANSTDDAEGGGIYNDSGPLTVTNSTFSGNFAANSGGGIFNFSGPLMVTNSTFSNNSSPFNAGAIYNFNGTLTVTHSTFADNAAPTGGSLLNTGTAYLAGVILETGARGANCVGTFNDNGYNLSDDASCSFSGTSADNATLNLSALSVATTPGQQVHTPHAGSDAIGAIPNGTTVNNNGVTLACNQTTTDQLGSNRPIVGGNACTSGAVEVAVDICPTPLAISDTTELANCITWANANPGADTLGLDANITLSAALPQITSVITLEGAGYYVDGANAYRIFYVTSTGNLTVNQIVVQNGSAFDGSGIFNLGTLTVTNSTFSGNSASYGGSIYNEIGTTTVTHSTFSGNSATSWGGGILSDSGTVTVTHSTFSGNSSSRGGGIYNDSGIATVTHSTFFGNSATTAGGSIHNLDGTTYLAGVILDTGTSGANCEIYSGTLNDNGYNLSDDASCGFSGTSADNATLNLSALSVATTPGQQVHTPHAGSDAIGAIPNGTTVNNNGVTLACNQTTTDQLGSNRPIVVGDPCTSGAVEVTPLCILPATVTTATELANCISEANANAAGLDTITLSANITLSTVLPQITSAIMLEGEGYTVDGASTYRVFEVTSTGNLAVNQITIQNGNQTIGGGIVNFSGTLTVTNSTFSNNNANAGGGIYSDSGALTVTNSTFSTNSSSDGGGIYNAGGTLIVTNSTFSANNANTGEGGGGIYNGGGTLTVTHTTFAGNNAVAGGGIFNDGTLALRNSVLANSTAGSDCTNTGAMSADANNLIENNSGCGTPVSTADPLLGPLQDNGGPTQTMALLAGSPAIDAGDNTICAAAPVNNLDQRGITRPHNSTCDIGAYEAGTTVCGVSAGNNYIFVQQSGVEIFVDSSTDLACLYVEEVPGNHPQATGAANGDQLKTGKYWRISGLQDAGGTPASSYIANLTLPQANLANPQVCKYVGGNGIGWDCAADVITTSTVTRNGLTSFSDWTVGTNVPTAVSLQSFTVGPQAAGGWVGLPALIGLLAAISVLFLWRRAARAFQQPDS